MKNTTNLSPQWTTPSDTSRYTLIGGSNQLSPRCWDGNPEILSALSEYRFHTSQESYDPLAAIRPLCDALVSSLTSTFEIVDAYFILHDRDVRLDDPSVPSTPHIHWLIRSKTKHYVSKWSKALHLHTKDSIRIPPGEPRNKHLNALAYLIHAKEEDKHLYSPYSVYSYGDSYMDIYNKNRRTWEKGRKIKSFNTQQSKESMQLLYDLITSGEVTREDVLSSDNPYYKIYRWKPSYFNEGFRVAQEKSFSEYQTQSARGDFEVPFVFINGNGGGIGKTELAQRTMSYIESKTGWRHYTTSGGTHGQEEYTGEEGFFADDMDAATFDIKGWIKFFDPKNRVHMDARNNNIPLACRYTMLTSCLNPFQYFVYGAKKSKNNDSEQFGQIIRRIALYAHVFRVGDATAPCSDDNTYVALYETQRVADQILTIPRTLQAKLNRKNEADKTIVTNFTFDEVNVRICKIDDAARIIANLILQWNKVDATVDTSDMRVFEPPELHYELGHRFKNTLALPYDENAPDTPLIVEPIEQDLFEPPIEIIGNPFTQNISIQNYNVTVGVPMSEPNDVLPAIEVPLEHELDGEVDSEHLQRQLE